MALRFDARIHAAVTAALDLESSFFTGRLGIDANGTVFERVLALPPGRQVVRLSCDVPAVAGPAGAGVFGLANCSVTEAESP